MVTAAASLLQIVTGARLPLCLSLAITILLVHAPSWGNASMIIQPSLCLTPGNYISTAASTSLA